MKDIFVTQANLPPLDEYVLEIADIWDTHWLTNMGCKHQKLQEMLKKYLSVENLALYVNGHNALECAIEVFSFPKGAQVITTPFTFSSTTHAIVRNGLVPVFCDINEANYTIDASKIEHLITEKTCAILPVHVYGNICDVQAIDAIAKKYKLKVLYDAAHAFGVQINGIGIGSYGDAAMFSFHATKVFNTIEGGAVTYQDQNLSLPLERLKNFGIAGPEDVEYVGGNSKMNEFSAAMGLCNLRYIELEIAKRKAIVDLYRAKLQDVKGVLLPQTLSGEIVENYAYFPIRVLKNDFGASRDELYDVMKENHIFARKYFYPLVSDYACYRNQYDSSQTPVAVKISSEIMTLPLYADLSLETVEYICDIIKKAVG